MQKNRTKLIAVAVLASCMLVIGFQNTETVATRVFFFTISMPRVLLVLISMLLGFILGVMVSLHFLGREDRLRQKTADRP